MFSLQSSKGKDIRRIKDYLFAISIVLLMGACSSQRFSPDINSMPAFRESAAVAVSPRQAIQSVEDYKLLTVTPEMIDYLDRFISTAMPQQQRARTLHKILRSPAFLGIEYQADKTLTADQVFAKEIANCISFANIYIALARHYGLDASYQLLEKYPQWNRKGLVVAMEIHVNTVLQLPRDTNLMVDISVDSAQIFGRTTLISDRSAAALFYNNLAMTELSSNDPAKNDPAKAYSYVAKALDLAPRRAILWSNLGAIYRGNGQFDAAEQAYKMALMLDPETFTAINNLASLYQHLQQWQEFEHYADRLNRLQEKNPYYYYSLAQLAQQENDYRQAIDYIEKAISLKQDEPEFVNLLNQLQRQLRRVAISSANSPQTASGVKASIQADMATLLPSSVQRLP